MIPVSNLASNFQNARVFIAGGLGFIGSNLARRLVQLGAQVHLYDCLVPEQGGLMFNIASIHDRLNVTVGDLRDSETLTAALGEPQFLFNLAGQSSHWDSMVDPCTDLEINCHAQIVLLETIRRSNLEPKVVFASTRQIYGRPAYLPVDEEHPLCPLDINGIHKIANESYHQLYARVYGLPCVILRLTNTIGPRMRVADARQTFVGLWIRQALEGIPFEVWGGTQIRDFNYVDDVVEALLMAALSDQASGRVYNLGSSQPVSLRQFAELLREATACEYVVRPFPENRKSIDIGNYYASYTRIHDELGWKPTTSIGDTIDRTVDYYRENLSQYTRTQVNDGKCAGA